MSFQYFSGQVRGLRGPGLTVAEQARLAAIEAKFPDIQSFWRGKKTVLLTDSIGLGSGTNSFFYQAGQMLGANLVNEGVIAAMARNGDHRRRASDDPNGWTGLPWDFVAYNLSATLADKNELITNWASKWRDRLTGSGKPSTLSSELQEYIRNCSWERRLKPHLDANDTALYLLFLGYNDEQAVGNVIDQTVDPQDRSTYIGAMTYLVGRILAANPKNRIAIIGHYEAQWRPTIARAQEIVAAQLNLPILRLWEQMGWSQFAPDGGAPMLNRILTVDGYHPHAQPDGWAVGEIARHIADWLRDGLPVAGAGGVAIRSQTPGDLLAFSSATPHTPQMRVFFSDDEGDIGPRGALYAPLGQSIYNVSLGRFQVDAITGTPAAGMLTHTQIAIPQDGQAYVLYSRFEGGGGIVDKVLFSGYSALDRSRTNEITPLATIWGPLANSRLPLTKLRDAYAPNLLQGGHVMAGPMTRSFPDVGTLVVKVSDPILKARGFHYGLRSQVNGRAAGGGYFPEGVDVAGRLCTIRWLAKSSLDNVLGNPPIIFLWNGAVGPDAGNLDLLINAGIVVEQRLSASIIVYRWTGYLPNRPLSHFFVSNDMGGTGASVTILGVQFGLGLDVRRDDFRTEYAPNLFANGRDMEGANVIVYDGNGAHADVGVAELRDLGFGRGILGPVGGRADAGGYFPTDRPVAGNVFTWRFHAGTTGPGAWGLPPVIFLWDGDTFLGGEILDSQVELERELGPQARAYRCTARIPDDVHPTRYFISLDQNGSLAQSLITGHQFAEGFDIDPDDFPIDTEADPAILAARDAANVQRSAMMKGRLGSGIKLQRPTSKWNLLLLNGQSLGGGQETWPRMTTSALAYTYMLGDAPFPAAYGSNNYPTFGAPSFQPLVSKVANDAHDTLLNDAQVSFVPTAQFDFSDGVQGFIATRGTLAVTNSVLTFAATAADGQLLRTGLTLSGAQSRYVRLRMRLMTAGAANWEGIIYYTTSGHGHSASFYKQIPDPGLTTGNWVIVEWDMGALTAGGTDWVNNTITGLRFDLSDVIKTWEIDWIAFSNTPIGTNYQNAQPAGSASLLPGNGAFGEPPNVIWARDAQMRLNDMMLSNGDASRNYVTINSAVSGQGLATFLKPNGAWYGRELDGVTKCKAAAGSDSIVITAQAIMQGEYDYEQLSGGINDKATYKIGLHKLFNDADGDYGAVTGQQLPFAKFIYQSGATFTKDYDANGRAALAIGMAQLEVSIERTDTFMVGPTYFTTDKGGHLDSNGSRWFGAYLAKVYHRVVHLGQDWEPLRPIRIDQVGRRIVMDFHVPEPPLKWKRPYVGNVATDIADKGFKVTDAGGNVAISSVEIIGQTQVAIVLSRPTAGPVSVWYAHQAAGGAGMLCDSDPAVSSDYYRYLPGTGMYPSANIPELVDKPYPLQNWGVAFIYPTGMGI